jgi:Ran GTPase-activating protein (RanGAP) involved in mRNA processing and transport
MASWKLYEALQLCNQLEELTFSSVVPADKDNSGPAYLMFALTQLCGLRSLTLNRGSVTSDQMALLQMLLETSSQSSWMSGLVSLDLSANSLGDTQGTQALCSLLPRLSALQKINLSHNAVTAESAQVLAPAFKHLVNLRYIDFGGNKLGARGAGAMASAWLRLSKVEHVSMNACRMPAAATIGIAHAVAKYPNLQYLDIRGCSLAGGEDGIAGAQVLAHALQRHTLASLLHFFHEDSGLRPVSARLLFRSLSLHTGLISLHVRCVFLYDQNDDALKEISWHLHKLQQLQSLRFSCDKLSASESEAFQAALYTLKNLKRLDLSHLWLGDAPADFLAFISKMKNLQELDLSSCNIVQFNAMETLARLLPHASGLKVLNLNKNPLKDDSAQALAAIIPRLWKLEHLELSGTDITNNGSNPIIVALDTHPAIAVCDLRDNIFVHRNLVPMVQRKGWLLVGMR